MNQKQMLRLPPAAYWLMAFVECFILRNWWTKGQRGSDGYSFLAVIIAIHITRQVFLGFRARDQQVDLRAIDAARKMVSGNCGTARWATKADIIKAGMDKPGGVFLGELDGTMIYYNKDGSLLTWAPPRSGKGVSIVVPNLLTYAGSTIVLDVKSELFCMTAKHRRENLGHRIVALSPWSKTLSNELGIFIRDHPFNPLGFLKAGNAHVVDDARMIAELLLPSKTSESASDNFWVQSGKEILLSFILLIISRGETLTLPKLRQILYMTPEETALLFDEMIRNTDFGGILSESGKKLSSIFRGSSKQWIGQVSYAQKALEIYNLDSPLGEHVSTGEIDWQSLKTDVPTTIYIIIPGEKLASYSAWLNLVLALSIEQIARVRSDRKVLLVCDEVANVGVIPSIPLGLTMKAGQGLQFLLIAQDPSQLERLYGKAGLQTFISSVAVINAFNVNDYQNAKLLSDLVGEMTVKTFTTSTPTGNNGQPPVISETTGEQGRALIRPEEVRLLSNEEQIIICRDLPPIKARKVKYYEKEEWRNLPEPNPYVTIENL
jgi:type IV secretion system protein VirD4